MSDIEMKVNEILGDGERLKSLLALEKERRGVPPNALVFVGMHNVAEQRWCEQQAVLKSRAVEHEVFAAYLSELILYSHRLGLVTELPTTPASLLDVGSEITWEDIKQLLKKEEAAAEDRAKRLAGVRVVRHFWDRMDEDGKRTRLINPDLPLGDRVLVEELAAKEGIEVIDVEEDPKLRGVIYQASRAETYPTMGWHFPWRHYSVGGRPDGLTHDYVYEYKTTRNKFLLGFVKPVALAQADLYGYFFRRPTKRVQIHVVEENVTKTFVEAVDPANAEYTLSAFARVEARESARPPKPWKCNQCDFRTTCPISQAK